MPTQNPISWLPRGEIRYRCCSEVRYTAAVIEETLPGGNTDGAVRIGGVVHKRASPWTPTVHALLRHLENAGVDGVPRALGFDEQGQG